MIGQKEAVVSEVKRVLGAAFTPGVTDARTLLTKAHKDEIAANITAMIENQQVTYGKKIESRETLRRYVRSMVDNHLKKAKELNGGSAYRPASSAGGGSSRASSPEILEMSKLQRTYPVGSNEYNEVARAIAEKRKELREKTRKDRQQQKVVSSINMSVLPTELGDLVKKLI